MKRPRRVLFPCVAAGMFFALSVRAQTPIRILPLGDSITYGSNTPGGYRLPLYVALTNAGYTVDYVGTQTGNGATGLPDSNHEGHGGWKIGGIYRNIDTWLESVDDPHVVLIHIGTNDSGEGGYFARAVDWLDELVTRIATCQPSAHIIVTTLLPRTGANDTNITNLFNPYVADKVAAQQALGRKVHYLDMHAYLDLTDLLSDNVHPNAGGYQKMADAWFPAITNVIGSTVDPNQPAVIRACGVSGGQQVTVSFNKSVSLASATNLANYALSGGLTVLGASLSANQRVVTLTTAPQTAGASYILTVNNVTDETSPAPLAIPADTQVTFQTNPSRGYLNNVPESADYTLVYSLDLPTASDYLNNVVPYSVDNTALITDFTRVAYYLELQRPGEELRYAWVSMDAFTNRADKLGLPTLASGALYQRYVTGMHVICNEPGVATGTGLTGNLEFWPYNYSAGNAISIPNASGSVYDFGDTCSLSANYSSMQIHNSAATQTVLTVSHWAANGTLEIGIGNQAMGHPDWTFSNDATDYSVRTLQVLVLRDGSDATAPAPVSAYAGCARDLVSVLFDEPVAAASVTSAAFALDHGVAVYTATLSSDLRTVLLKTSPHPAASLLTLSIAGVRDISPSANAVPAGTTIAVAPVTVPPEVISNIGTNSGDLAEGYELVYSLDIPLRGNFIGIPDFYRYSQSELTRTFDRIAYYMELQPANGSVQYLWASMDAFSADARKIGVPTAASGAVWQQEVANLDVLSNVAGVSNGVGMAGGNLEFWPTDYGASNAMAVAGASDTACDFGDERRTSGSHGSMQLHNYLAQQTLFAMNNWGADNQTIAVGIGNRTGQTHTDWTFANNSGAFTRRVLHVLVRPTAPPALPPEVEANVPEAVGYQLVYTIDIPVNGDFNTNSAAYYSANNTTNGISSTFSRIGYYLELQKGSDPTQYIWTAMDAFTTDARKIAIPTNGTHFRQYVNDLDVRSNVAGISNGIHLATGSIEIWPSNYGAQNDLGVPGATASEFDFGDGGGNTGGGGHGCMQVHNYAAAQTLFAINHFNSRNVIGLGIGNNPTLTNKDPDYTFTYNAGTYNYRRLHVFILPGVKADSTRPTLVNATASLALDQVSVRFNEALADRAADASLYTLDNGATVTGARLSSDMKTVVLATSTLTAGLTYTLRVTGVYDRSVPGNAILPNSPMTFAAPAGALPDVLTHVPEAAGYELVHQLAVGDTVYYAYGCNYATDQSYFARTQSFDRIAYCVELVTNGVSKWVYVSMDAFTSDLTKIGVPTADRGEIWQQYVSNLNVYASDNVANTAVTTGVGIAAGNLEFWPSNYGQGNVKSIPGASGSLFDFGDDIGSNTGAGHGSMQVHNYLQGHTIFAMNSFGSNGRQVCLGLGNNPVWTSSDPDWTHTYNGRTYSTKNIYVLVRPGTPLPTGTPPDLWNQPLPRTVLLGTAVTLSVFSPNAVSYQWRKNGTVIAGANLPFLAFTPADFGDNGDYDVVLYGTGTATTVSQSAMLRVYPLGTVLWLR